MYGECVCMVMCVCVYCERVAFACKADNPTSDHGLLISL